MDTNEVNSLFPRFFFFCDFFSFFWWNLDDLVANMTNLFWEKLNSACCEGTLELIGHYFSWICCWFLKHFSLISKKRSFLEKALCLKKCFKNQHQIVEITLNLIDVLRLSLSCLWNGFPIFFKIRLTARIWTLLLEAKTRCWYGWSENSCTFGKIQS